MENIVNTKNLFDKDFRRELMENPKEVVLELGLKLENDVEIKVVENTKERFHLVFPNNELLDDLLNISASGCHGCVGTAGTAGSGGTVGGSLGSFGSVGTYGSYGCGDSGDSGIDI